MGNDHSGIRRASVVTVATRAHLALLHGLAMTRQAIGVLEDLPGLGRRSLPLSKRGSMPLLLERRLVLLSLSL